MIGVPKIPAQREEERMNTRKTVLTVLVILLLVLHCLYGIYPIVTQADRGYQFL